MIKSHDLIKIYWCYNTHVFLWTIFLVSLRFDLIRFDILRKTNHKKTKINK
jgi:hypothetical protein